MKSGKSRHALITVDTEALPKRATSDHIDRLIWGQHEAGTAGVREMCHAADEVGSKLVFFVDACGGYTQPDKMAEVVKWLDAAGHDVQLHTHSEYLPEQFWPEHGFKYRPRFLNQYDEDKAAFTLRHFGKFITDLTGKPLCAFRAGSFRWNANSIKAMVKADIPLSFNNSMHASLVGQCTYSEPTNSPYRWSNGVIEVPVTERKFFPLIGKEWWGRLQFPVGGNWFGSPPWRVLRPFTVGADSSLVVLLLHSWSLLYWDENGYAVYRNERRIEEFRKLVRRLSKDYDVITTADFLDLHARGMIDASRTVDLSCAEMKPSQPKKKG